MPDFANMIGKELSAVGLSSDKASIEFRFCDGTTRKFEVEGDCCSNSWIEHLETPSVIEGAKISAVTESGEVEDSTEHECLQVYHTKFSTDRGDIVLEYRNSSNGYYGGYLIDA